LNYKLDELKLYLLYYSQLQFQLIKECQKRTLNKTTTDSTQVVSKRQLKPLNTLMALATPKKHLI